MVVVVRKLNCLRRKSYVKMMAEVCDARGCGVDELTANKKMDVVLR
jgi:hypothetical protein